MVRTHSIKSIIPDKVLAITLVKVKIITANNKYDNNLLIVSGMDKLFIVQYKPTPEHQEIGNPFKALTKYIAMNLYLHYFVNND